MKTSKLIRALIAGGVIGLTSVSGFAAGLGRLTVQSALGQPLLAEIELLSVQKGEADTLAARIASPNAFQEAKIDYSPILGSVHFSVEKRANGQPYLRLTTPQPIEEPFVDMLVELSSASGRLVREFPILLDPPGVVSSISVSPIGKSAAAPSSQPASGQPAPAAPPGGDGKAGGDQYTVKKGDTLYKVASQIKPGDVNLDQMVVALFRENRQAFISDNMNLMKSGSILRVPSAEQVSAVPAGDATRDIRAQAADWNAYRNKLAGQVAAAPAEAGNTSQSAAGKIGKAAVDQPAAPAAASKDVLKLSKGAEDKAAAGKPSSDAQINALREEATARENQIREEKARVAQLEKNIQDMQQLLAMKNQSMAEAQKQAEAGKQTPAAAAKTPVQPAAPPVTAPRETMPATTTTAPPAAPSGQVDTAPAAPVAQSTTAGEAAPKPAVKKALTVPVPTEPGLFDEFMDNPMYQIAAAGILALLALLGYRAFKRRRPAPMTTGATSSLVSDLKSGTMANSKASGVVDTGNSSFLTDFEKTGPGIIDIEEVDPVAEAEVYIAYGRDAQAEEILKEAMVKDATRHEIPLKLLEIYSARKSAASFEAVARDMHRSIGPAHPLWNRVAEMGRQLDPADPLYAQAGAPVIGSATTAQPLYSEVYAAPQNAKPAAPAISPDELPVAHDEALDFDLHSPSPTAAEHSAPAGTAAPDLDLSMEFAAPTDAAVDSNLMNFDLGGGVVKPLRDRPEPPAAEQTQLVRPKRNAQFSDDDLDLSEFGIAARPADDTPPAPAKEAPAADSAQPWLNGSEAIIPAAVHTAAKRPAATPDFGSLNLDLSPASTSAETAVQDGDSEWHSVATKLDLARAYLEIGDKDGAREILQEVLQEGDGEQKREAETLTAAIH